MRIIFIILVFVALTLVSTSVSAQPTGSGSESSWSSSSSHGGNCEGNFWAWFCARHPNHPNCATAAAIDGFIWLLVGGIAGGALRIYIYHKENKDGDK